MPEDQSQPDEQQQDPPATGDQQQSQQQDPPDLGDPGKRALAAERTARQAAEKANRDLQARLTALEEKDLDDLAKAQAENQRLTARIAETEAVAAKAQLDLIKANAAAAANLPAGWGVRLRGDTAEDIEADAKALAADLSGHHRGMAPPTPGQGQDSKPPSGVDAGADLFAERHGKQ